MFKRIMLTLTFAAAFGAAGLSLLNNAGAQWYGWSRPYTSYYYAPRSYVYSAPYRPYYNTYYDGYYGTRPYYSAYYGDPGYYYYQPAPRVAVQVGPYWR